MCRNKHSDCICQSSDDSDIENDNVNDVIVAQPACNQNVSDEEEGEDLEGLPSQKMGCEDEDREVGVVHGEVESETVATVQKALTEESRADGATSIPDSMDCMQYDTAEVLARCERGGGGEVQNSSSAPAPIVGLQTGPKLKPENKVSTCEIPPFKPCVTPTVSGDSDIDEDCDLFTTPRSSWQSPDKPSHKEQRKKWQARGAKT